MEMTKALAAFFAVGLLSYASIGTAGPHGPGAPGVHFGPGPGHHAAPVHRPAPRPAPPPPHRGHGPRHHVVEDVVVGAAVIGLGLGLAGAIDNATRPSTTTYVVPSQPTYVPPGYVVSPAPVTVAPAPSVVYQAPTTTAVPSGNVMYWCQASSNFYPYVTECTSGWEVKVMPRQ